MGRKRTPGLVKRAEVWHVDKEITGFGRLCESSGTSDLEEAERFLARRLEEIRKATVYGVRPARTFRQAATRFLEKRMDMRSVGRDAQDLKLADPYIGDLDLRFVHDGTLEPFINARQQEGRAPGTINRTLRTVHNVLKHAAKWRDANNLTWLEVAPQITELDDSQKRKPHPMDWAEQELLFSKLPEHLRIMATYGTNTGCREKEIVRLRWDWEFDVPELQTSLFIVPGEFTKNGEDKVVVLNRMARDIIESQRGKHPERVFTYAVHEREAGPDGKRIKKGKIVRTTYEPTTRIYNSGWKLARQKAAASYEATLGRKCPDLFRCIRVQDLRHTFGRRLRAAGVSYEDRQDLLGHKSSRITSHYSAAEIGNLIAAVEKIAEPVSRKSPAVLLVRSASKQANSSKALISEDKNGGDSWNRTSDLSIMSAAL